LDEIEIEREREKVTRGMEYIMRTFILYPSLYSNYGDQSRE
jgi:hypothetical protein